VQGTEFKHQFLKHTKKRKIKNFKHFQIYICAKFHETNTTVHQSPDSGLQHNKLRLQYPTLTNIYVYIEHPDL
jgi:hypothetical protein